MLPLRVSHAEEGNDCQGVTRSHRRARKREGGRSSAQCSTSSIDLTSDNREAARRERMDGKRPKVRFATFCKFVLRGPRRAEPCHRWRSYVGRWLASCSTIIGGSFVRSSLVRSPSPAARKWKRETCFFGGDRRADGTGEERRRRRGGGGCGGGGAFPLFP